MSEPKDTKPASGALRCYVAAATGNALERRQNMFYWQGRSFPGLVDPEQNALYDDPEDSFNEHVSIPTAIERGLIRST